MSNDPLVWLVVILVLFSPIWVYLLAKMVTFGILKAKQQFNQEEKDGIDQKRRSQEKTP